MFSMPLKLIIWVVCLTPASKFALMEGTELQNIFCYLEDYVQVFHSHWLCKCNCSYLFIQTFLGREVRKQYSQWFRILCFCWSHLTSNSIQLLSSSQLQAHMTQLEPCYATTAVHLPSLSRKLGICISHKLMLWAGDPCWEPELLLITSDSWPWIWSICFHVVTAHFLKISCSFWGSLEDIWYLFMLWVISYMGWGQVIFSPDLFLQLSFTENLQFPGHGKIL